jgi:sugar diacid utilization regulator
VIAAGAKAREAVRALAAGLGRELLSVSPGDELVWAWLGGRRPVDIAALARLVSATSEHAGVSLAIGGSGSGIDGWRLTHRQAQAAMLVAQRRPQQLTRYADVSLLAAVLRDQELASSLVEAHLSPLDGHKDSAVSRETLRAYFAAGATRRRPRPL